RMGRRRHFLGAMAGDDDQPLGRNAAPGAQRMRQQRYGSQRMQDLRQVGIHSAALARGQDDDGDRHWSGVSQKRSKASISGRFVRKGHDLSDSISLSFSRRKKPPSMTPLAPRVAAFDLDGTLADTSADLLAAAHAT